jgi:hypothetical protein
LVICFTMYRRFGATTCEEIIIAESVIQTRQWRTSSPTRGHLTKRKVMYVKASSDPSTAPGRLDECIGTVLTECDS